MIDHEMVRIRLIGPIGAWTAKGESVLPSGRKTRALLACITMAAPRPVLRSRLSELLWSRSPKDQAYASLRQEIHRLQAALSPAEANILVVTRDDLALRPGTVLTDVQEVTQASSERPAALSLLTADLLEGLEGIDPSFNIWLQAERKRLRNRALRIAESVLRQVTSPDDAIEAAERVLAIDCAHEGAWRALMNIHDARGERGLAIQAYNRCCAALTDTVGATPSAETQKKFADIRGSSLRREPQNEPPSGEVATTTRRGIHVGVMPFRLIGSADKHASLAAGLAAEIANALSQFRGLFTVSANSLDRFAADNRDEALIKRELGLDFLLDGSVQRADSKSRIYLQLLDLRANSQVTWARRFECESDDLLSLQDEITAEVAAQIDPEILRTEARRSTSGKPAHPTAYDLMLRAIPLIGRMEYEPFMQAGRYLADAIALEPDYAQLYGWYAYWHVFLVGQDWAADPETITERAGGLADRAIVLDPFDARGLAISGHVRAYLHHRPRDAMGLHDRALSLNPNLAIAWALSGITHAYAGNLEEAERRNNRYKALSPRDPHAFFFDAFSVLIHLMKHEYEAAVEVGRAVIQLNPSFSATYKPYLAALGHLRRDQETATTRRRLLALEPHFTIESFLENYSIERDCDRIHYAEGLRLAGLPALSHACCAGD